MSKETSTTDKILTLTFAGGTGNVTGANFLVEGEGIKFLVDCGLEQGTKSADDKNWAPFIYDPASIDALFITHAHIDHILGNSFVKRTYNLDYYLHREDLTTLHSVVNYAHVYGFHGYEPSPEPTHFLNHGDKLVFGGIELDVFFTPGHAPGHVVFYNAENKFVINGDVLFNGSFGRVDLPGGDIEILKKSIHEIMFQLPEDTIVHCGHGPATTIGKEKRSNYILNF